MLFRHAFKLLGRLLAANPAYLPTKRGFEHQYGLWFGNIDYFTHKRDGELDWHRNDQPCINGPLRAGKGSIFEGGVRVCAFACWPGHIPAGNDWKLVHGENKKNVASGEEGDLLFSLTEDIGETKNLAASNPEKLAEMKEFLHKLLKNAVPSGAPRGKGGKPAASDEE